MESLRASEQKKWNLKIYSIAYNLYIITFDKKAVFSSTFVYELAGACKN